MTTTTTPVYGPQQLGDPEVTAILGEVLDDLPPLVLEVPTYAELPMPPQVALTFWVCELCSAVVFRRDRHDPYCAAREPVDAPEDPRRVKQPGRDPRRKEGQQV